MTTELALKAEIAKIRTERNLLFDALSLHMQSTGITDEAMSKVAALRLVLADSETRVKTECERLAAGWGEAAKERDQAQARAERKTIDANEARAEVERLTSLLPPTVGERGRGYVGQGDWSVYAEKVQTERDEARAEVVVAQGFHDVAVKERDYERLRALKAESESATLREDFATMKRWHDESVSLLCEIASHVGNPERPDGSADFDAVPALVAALREQLVERYIDGLRAYAWWKDGVEYVGTAGQTLEAAIALARK
jgi:hypothetical protein